MSVFDQELILPGVITDIISDYNAGYDTSQFGTTDSVAIIGTAFNGPVGKPVKVYSPEHAKYVFGQTFDFKTRREATLVAEIQDAWDRGCRTIYAIRVSGKEMYKDFNLASDVKAKLRVSGIFPHNGNKEVYFEYDAVDTLTEVANGSEATIKIYKPANRATIEEKMQGKVVKENSILVNTIKLGSSWNVGSSTRLVDFIKLFNEYRYNNVIRLSIVDEEGNDITETSLAQGLAFGDVFPGVYFIGRDRNNPKIIAKTEVTSKFVPEEEKDSIYENFSGDIFKTLKVNTDVTASYPIYHKDATQLNKLIDKVEEVTMVKLFDFLDVAGKVDALWLQDKVDYEEVRIDDFDMYKKLGSGYATTAKIIETKEGTGVYKVVEVTSENEVNRVSAINDGIYSMLENLRSDYRVLTGKYADLPIKGSLPKKSEFLVTNPINSGIFSDTVTVIPKIDAKDLDTAPKSYKFELRTLDEDADILSKDVMIEGLYNKNGVYTVCSYAITADNVSDLEAKKDQLSEGDLALVLDTMYRKVGKELVALENHALYGSEFEGKLVVAEDAIYKVNESSKDSLKFAVVNELSEIGEAKFLVADVRGKVVVFGVTPNDALIDGVEPVALLEDVLLESSSMFASIVPRFSSEGLVELVTLRAMNLEATSLGELIVQMNEDKVLSEKFEFDMHHSLDEAIRYVAVLPEVFASPITGDLINTEVSLVGTSKPNVAIVDRGVPVYDKSLYIPFKTTDNFARHLAQHCTYTGLKTAPTHGVIGCSKLITTNLKTIADKVDSLVDLDLNLYAKRPNGNDMLDKNNMPYPIGRSISVTFFQHSVETDDNYTYIGAGASAYAGMVSVLPIDQSSTAQPINLSDITFELTNYQLGRLTQAGYVTVKNSYTRGYVITDGVTMAPATSPFRRLAVARIVNGIDEAIRAAAEPFIGKQNHLANRNSLQTAIKSSLDKMLDNLIERYDFKLVVDRAAERMGIIEIDYTIVPIYEIREVRNRIAVKDNQ